MTDENYYKDDLIKLGERIRKLREEKQYSQEVLGFKANLHRNYISSLELAQKNPTYTTLIKIASALDITVAELINKEEDL
ncbi:helix-turn-helix domain-containing protein [Shouchella clausii]|uniref:helix-turn-helix domain-containing protein n=1 Tax=Shouchella clausii TaxID=79880 RepID=UPI0028A23385|nr:helix-turn-helix transcriptional regulator [Shouchella clausii]